MVLIVGRFADSGGQPLHCFLEVNLKGEVIEYGADPNKIHFPVPKLFQVNGFLEIELPSSGSVPFTFSLYSEGESVRYFLLSNGNEYLGEVHRQDGVWYTGAYHSNSSAELVRNATSTRTEIRRPFEAIVPNVERLEFNELLPVGVSQSTLDTAAYNVARILVEKFPEVISPSPDWTGVYSPDSVYRYNQSAEYQGASYVWYSKNQGNVAPPNSEYWQRI